MKMVGSIVAAIICVVFAGSAAVVVGSLGWLCATAWFMPMIVRIALSIMLFAVALGVAGVGAHGAFSAFNDTPNDRGES